MYALRNLIDYAIQAYIFLVFARALISWVSPDPYNPIVRFLYRTTEPLLRPVRNALPTMAMGLDLSPMVVILGLVLVENYVVPLLLPW